MLLTEMNVDDLTKLEHLRVERLLCLFSSSLPRCLIQIDTSNMLTVYEHEGKNFKHLTEHPAGSESLDTTGGFTVDKEGLVDNFAIEPEIYYETPGDLPAQECHKPEPTDR